MNMVILDENGRPIQNGDVFDIGQTVDGTSKFVFLFANNGVQIYFVTHDTGVVGHRYHYDEQDLIKTVQNLDWMYDITYLGNIFHPDEPRANI